MADTKTVTVETIEFLSDEESNRILRSEIEDRLTSEKSGQITTRELTDEEQLPDVCKVTPIEAYMSTNLNHQMSSYDKLATRMLNLLGYPSVAVTDLHRDQIYQAIAMAVEMFTRYGGYTLEYLIFDSRLYEPNKGIRLDNLYTIASMQTVHQNGGNQYWIDRGPDQILQAADDVYVTRKPISKADYYITEEQYNLLINKCKKADKALLCYLRDISNRYPDGIEELSVISGILYMYLVEKRGHNKDDFKKSKDKVVTEGGEELTIYMQDEKLGRFRDPLYYEKTYDYDLMDYRKVREVCRFVEGSDRSIYSIFAQEMALSEQAYYSWEFKNKGFGLTERYCLDEWINARNKILARERSWSFNADTQYFTIIPQPRVFTPFTGVIEAYVEKPLRDIIKDPWVFDYAFALVKSVIGNIRGRWGDVQLLGGGVISGNKLAQEGQQEIKELKQMLIEKGGYGGVSRPVFYVR